MPFAQGLTSKHVVYKLYTRRLVFMPRIARKYSNDFETFYKLYIPPKTSNKIDASKAYQKVWYDLPEQTLLLACVQAYNEWLSEHKGHFKFHPAAWLKKRAWENWLEEGKKMIERDKNQIEPRAKAEPKRHPPSRPIGWWGQPRKLWKPEWKESEVPSGQMVRDEVTDQLRAPRCW